MNVQRGAEEQQGVHKSGGMFGKGQPEANRRWRPRREVRPRVGRRGNGQRKHKEEGV